MLFVRRGKISAYGFETSVAPDVWQQFKLLGIWAAQYIANYCHHNNCLCNTHIANICVNCNKWLAPIFAYLGVVSISLINKMDIRLLIKSEPLGQGRKCWTTAISNHIMIKLLLLG